MNRNVTATISHKYNIKMFCWIKECLRYFMNRIQIKDRRMGTYEINKILLPCFDDKIFTPNNGYDGLTLEHNFCAITFQ